ncbi:MAG: phosphate ABC transporter permease PstA [Candidatus Jordarchaeum sp.]|uniref:phosphate ABC transporter permease PstA n=1 Tax=Candidatus Jordarchaeum sp. TaxID=2823881 RepID=UPI004049FA91
MKKLREELKGIPPGEAKIRSILGDVLIGIPTFLAILAFFIILGTVLFYGWPTFTFNFPSFLTSSPIPNTDLRLGGIAPMIFGTFALVVGAMIIAIPLGVMSSIYMSEYLVQGKLKSFINQVVNNLAGVPSIVFGLFGLSFLLRYLNIAEGGPSLVSGWIVLGFMALPIIIKSTNNALDAVPKEFREASQALGATKWQTITTVTLPLASPGISTGTILGIGRIVGETAAILFIAVVVSQSNYYPATIYDPVMALTYHIYYMAVESPYAADTLGIQHGTALVLMILVLLLSAAAIYIRYRAQQRKRGW